MSADERGCSFALAPGAERLAPLVRRAAERMPKLAGRPIRIEVRRGLRDKHGPVHAGAFLRERRIAFNCTRAEFARIFVHEVFHFVWVKLGNAARRAFEGVVADEIARGVRGELGWAAESRKRKLKAGDLEARTRRWREYCCESFCDSAAWLYSGLAAHDEFTLGKRARGAREQWFRRLAQGRIPV